MSILLETATIKESLFPDFDGIIKVLVLGGDFVMAADHPAEYFAAKGYETIVARGYDIELALSLLPFLFFFEQGSKKLKQLYRYLKLVPYKTSGDTIYKTNIKKIRYI
jgi:hypothetical protein